MVRVLVTGMSGTGKSTVLAELARRGHRVIDTDLDGLGVEVTGPDGTVEQLWDEDRMRQALADEGPGLTFVAGCVANQGRFYDRFAAVVLLSAPREVLLHRVATRTANPFGRDPAERARILADLEAVEPLLRRGCDTEIVTTRPVAEVADTLVALAEDRRSPGSVPVSPC